MPWEITTVEHDFILIYDFNHILLLHTQLSILLLIILVFKHQLSNLEILELTTATQLNLDIQFGGGHKRSKNLIST